jgi:hypothetical protein
MGLFCINIQLKRAPGIDLAFIREAVAELGSTDLFTQYDEEEGFARGPYISFYFETSSPTEAWPIIRSKFYEDARMGAFLRQSSLVVCQGQNGWDDYLLLYHYDPKVPLDQLPVQKRSFLRQRCKARQSRL